MDRQPSELGLDIGEVTINDTPTFLADHLPYGAIARVAWGARGRAKLSTI